MENYFKRKFMPGGGSSSSANKEVNAEVEEENRNSKGLYDIDLANLSADPGLRHPISDYHPNVQDDVRRAYLQRKPCQPRGHEFPQTLQGKLRRRFCESWFDQHPNWLEYSIKKDAAYCLCCYLFKSESNKNAFVVDGFRNWKKKEKIDAHVGGPNSLHNQALSKCEALLNQHQHLRTIIEKHTKQAQSDYRVRLLASIETCCLLLRQGLAFRGHHESTDSDNRGNFLEVLKFLSDHNEDIGRVTLDNSPGNVKLTSPDTQRDIVRACAIETSKVIVRELGDSLFSILVNEARDIALKEQMDVVIRFVDKLGQVVERLLGIVHVADTSASSLKTEIDALFSTNNLSISGLRGQGYDGASNMSGKFNGLKYLILSENSCAYYVHCFAHQVQLALVAVAKNHDMISELFLLLSMVVNFIGGSCKRHEILLECQSMRLLEGIESGEIKIGSGQNQMSTLKRASDTRWSSFFNTVVSLIKLFSTVIDVLEFVRENGNREQRGEALLLLKGLQCFDTAFSLHLMKHILGITHELSQSLQKKDQDIVNAMQAVQIAKQRLQKFRDSGWDNLLKEIALFCSKMNINVPNMNDIYVSVGRPRRNVERNTNLHRYKVEIFCTIIDMQLQELNSRFNEMNTELLLCVACLSPIDAFSYFDKRKLLRLAEFYPVEFSSIEIDLLDNQLESYIIDMTSHQGFLNLSGLIDLATQMVKYKKDRL